ncbi:MAG TPA: 30S ribosomal protein S6 [Candidatus Paceibacterota bacterium]|jgi:ribosomal protein S6|nr:30S ribosomal protein S6 [Candidatus Paceibacterota bacterium]
MENSAQNAHETEEKVLKVYEVGYHLVPSVPEEQVPAEVGAIKEFIEGQGGLFISDEFPKMRQLAYAIPKVVDGRKQNFEEAYFGWVKFEAPSEAAPAIQKALDSNPHVLRSLLIETVRENTMSVAKPAFKKDDEKNSASGEEKEITKEDEERISKSIDELVAE